jgi:predicted unusual protein kinase regulating ubiquinone biosynthesis (AarF/ABC1/UbiB family)
MAMTARQGTNRRLAVANPLVATVAAGVAGAIAAGALMRRRNRQHGVASGPVRATSRAARSAELALLGSRVGTAAASNRARRIFASAARKEELDAQLELRTAEQVAATLGNMKGVLMKIGQLASFVDDGMPEPVREALAELQQDAPPMSDELAAGVVEAELGKPPDRLFEEWDPIPIAAASIGQVHRAMTTDGRAVAVKVQYPGIAEAMAADLDNIDLAMFATPVLWKGFDADGVVQELRERLVEELDYRLEAAHQRMFASWYRDHPFIHVPEVIDELSAGRVLTTELAEGVRFAELDRWDQEERNLAAESIYRFVFRSLYRFHAFNGDPHPGNYLFRPGGRVSFLDFGLVRRFEPIDIERLLGIVRAAVLDPDPLALRRAEEEAGFIVPGAPVADDRVAEYMTTFFEPVLVDRVTTISPEYASELARRFLFGRATYGDVIKWANLPPPFVILQRINLGLIAILGRLAATANWRRIAEEMWPITDGSPFTELGREEAAWWRDAAGSSGRRAP